MSAPIFSMCCKNGAVLLSLLILVGCQPSSSDHQTVSEDSEQIASPIIVEADSVTMPPDYILNIKPSRYQPSLGLQGVTEPARQSRFITKRDITVHSVLAVEGQWVEKGAPLLIVQRRLTEDNIAAENLQKLTEKVTDKSTKEAIIDDIQQNDADSDVNVNNRANTSIGVSADVEPFSVSSEEVVIANEVQEKGDDIDKKTQGSKTDNKQATSDKNDAPLSAIPLIIVRASFAGQVDALYVQAEQHVDADTPLLHLRDDKNLHFIATLPMQAESQLSIGQTVNFAAEGLTDKFTGQVSKLIADNRPDELQVYVSVVKNDASRNKLQPNMKVMGRVDYGQIKVGTIVPERGIHDADLSALKKPPYQSMLPVVANVWIIQQDQRLTRQSVEVIKYDPSTNQYLIAGVSNDSLICLADLPVAAVGKKVIVS